MAIATVCVVIPTSSQAASFVGDRADLQGSDRVDWSSLRVISTFKVLPNNFSATSEQRLKLNIQIPQALSSQITPSVVFQTLPSSPAIPISFTTGVPIFAISIQFKPLPEPDSSVLIALVVIWLGLVAIRCTWFGLQASKTKRKI